jgi:hypothetical protein
MTVAFVQIAVPILTVKPVTKYWPVSVKVVPPFTLPELGVTEVMAGAGAVVEAEFELAIFAERDAGTAMVQPDKNGNIIIKIIPKRPSMKKPLNLNILPILSDITRV